MCVCAQLTTQFIHLHKQLLPLKELCWRRRPLDGRAALIWRGLHYFYFNHRTDYFQQNDKGTVRWVSLRLAAIPLIIEKQDVTVLSLYHPFFIPACAHSGSLREFPRLQLPRVRGFSHTYILYILYILLTLIYITPFFLLSHHFNTGLHPAQNRGLPRSRSKGRSRASGRQHRSTILAWYVRRRLFNFHIIL